MKSTVIAYLLWFFLGFAGIHKFYLNKTGLGIIYFFTFGLFGIGWIIDLFTLAGQVERYNSEMGYTPGTTTVSIKPATGLEKTVLQQILKDQPQETRIKVSSSFSGISANIEFAVEIDPSKKQEYMNATNARGFSSVWCNEGNMSTVLYSSGNVDEGMIPRIIDWIISMKKIGQSAMIHYTGREGEKFVQF